mmetsp:Transcript_6823/g.22643  ORF Transcript_6823/g.22643 Transcript_6823/m.22643 type:complete len:862 (-) Transcript_6823:1898-4483(-)
MDDEERHRLADKAQLLGRGADALLAGVVEPVLELGEPGFDVLAVREGAALAAEQEGVEELHVDEGEDLGEELAHEEARDVVLPHHLAQLLERLEDCAPVGAERRAVRRGAARRAPLRRPAGALRRLDALPELRRDLLLDVVAEHPVNLLHERRELLLEEERRVLSLHLPHARDARLVAARAAARLLARRAAEPAPHPEPVEDARARAPARLRARTRRRLERPLQEAQQRRGVGQPVRQNLVVLLFLLDGAVHRLDDAVEELRALTLECTPVEQRAENHHRGSGSPVRKPDVLRDAPQQEILFRLLVLLVAPRLFRVELRLLPVQVLGAVGLGDVAQPRLGHVGDGPERGGAAAPASAPRSRRAQLAAVGSRDALDELLLAQTVGALGEVRRTLGERLVLALELAHALAQGLVLALEHLPRLIELARARLRLVLGIARLRKLRHELLHLRLRIARHLLELGGEGFDGLLGVCLHLREPRLGRLHLGPRRCRLGHHLRRLGALLRLRHRLRLLLFHREPHLLQLARVPLVVEPLALLELRDAALLRLRLGALELHLLLQLALRLEQRARLALLLLEPAELPARLLGAPRRLKRHRRLAHTHEAVPCRAPAPRALDRERGPLLPLRDERPPRNKPTPRTLHQNCRRPPPQKIPARLVPAHPRLHLRRRALAPQVARQRARCHPAGASLQRHRRCLCALECRKRQHPAHVLLDRRRRRVELVRPHRVEHRHLACSEKHLGQPNLKPLELRLFADGAHEGRLVRVTDEARHQQPEPIHKLVPRLAARVPSTADADSLQHTAAPELVQHVGVLKHARLVGHVWLDAPHIMGLRLVQLRHELRELSLEARADRGELHRRLDRRRASRP